MIKEDVEKLKSALVSIRNHILSREKNKDKDSDKYIPYYIGIMESIIFRDDQFTDKSLAE